MRPRADKPAVLIRPSSATAPATMAPGLIELRISAEASLQVSVSRTGRRRPGRAGDVCFYTARREAGAG
jgi:hypothetical protein